MIYYMIFFLLIFGILMFLGRRGTGRLQKVLEILSDCKAHSTLEIANRANTVAAGSCISELRTNGYEIECKYKGLSDSNRKIYEYKLV